MSGTEPPADGANGPPAGAPAPPGEPQEPAPPPTAVGDPDRRVAFHDAPTAVLDTTSVVRYDAATVTPTRAPASAPSPFNRGDRIGEGGRFEIGEKLGAGGMGYVFRAADTHLDRTVAIKLILQNGGMPLEQLVALLKREAKATAKLSHENIVAIFDMDTYADVPFLVMELLDGQSLDVMMARGLGALRATEIMVHVAQGLAHAHAHGIVHRDLKPSNVFVLRDGRAKILDFGISRVERPLVATVAGGDRGPTVSGVGTPAYMAPEQWRGEPENGRTDIWAAGVMFYQMLTGSLPCTPNELALRFTTKSVRPRARAPSVRLLAPDLPEEAEVIVSTALNEDPAGRFQTARELCDALRRLEQALGGRPAHGDAPARPAPRVERRPMTILACSLEGSDALDLDDVVEMDRRFYQVSADTMKRAEGAIGTPIGGRFFCSFGYPIVKETDAQRAVRAALEIVDAMRDHARAGGAGPELTFRIGVHSGVVGLPALPGAGQGLPAMQGNVPNVALRVAEAAAPGSVCVSQATLELTSGIFVTELRAEGVRGRPRVHRVKGETELVSRFDHALPAGLTPFVGREAELATLHRLWSEAQAGHGRIVVVRGEPGIGKSRIVETLRERVIEEQNTRLTCQCWPQFKNSALRPLILLVARSMNLQREDTDGEKLTKIERGLASLGFQLPEAMPLFASLLSIPIEGRYAPLGLTPEQQRHATLEALASMLLRTAAVRPTLFVIEDMHWVDHSTIEYLTTLLDRIATSRLLVVLTCRPEFHVPWSAQPHLHEIALDRLSSSATASMIERASRDRLPAEVTARLVAATDGVPLFVEELVRMFVESWSPDDTTQRGAHLAIPGTLHELLLARLDRLRGAGKEVAQIGSILGRDFDYALVQAIATLDELTLQDGLAILVEAGVLYHLGQPPNSKYVFKHALIHQAAYQSLVKVERQRLHQRAADVLTRVFQGTVEQEPELLGYHHAEAGNTGAAFPYWEKAGQRATTRGALVEAIGHYQRARDALRALPEGPARDRRELSLLLALGAPLMSVHGYATPEVEKTYARARELARASGSHGDVFPAMQGLWQFYYVRGMLPVSRELGSELLEIAREAGSSTFLLLAHRAIAASAFLQGDYEACRDHTQRGFAMYDAREHGSLALRTGHDPGVAHGVYLAWALWLLGYPDQALRRVEETIALAKRLDHPLTFVYALCYAALVQNHRGEHAAAAALADEALAITIPNKFALWTAWATVQRGWSAAGLGDTDQGIPWMEEGIAGWKKTGARVGLTFFSVTLAEVCFRAGRFAETARLLDDATPMIAANDEHFYEAEMCRLEGELALIHAPSSEAAEGHYRRGAELARRLNGKSWELRLAMSRARLHAGSSGEEQARGELRRVLGWFTEGHETADLRAARTLLDNAVMR